MPRIARHRHQPVAAVPQRRVEGHERTMQPPGLRRAICAGKGIARLSYIDTDHRAAGLDRFAKCQIVGEAEIASKPDDGGRVAGLWHWQSCGRLLMSYAGPSRKFRPQA